MVDIALHMVNDCITVIMAVLACMLFSSGEYNCVYKMTTETYAHDENTTTCRTAELEATHGQLFP